MSPAEANLILRPLIEAASPEDRRRAARVGVYAAAAADAFGLGAERVLLARVLAELESLPHAALPPTALAMRAAASDDEDVERIVALALAYDRQSVSGGQDSAESWLSRHGSTEFGTERAAALRTCAGLIQPQNS